jgi:hypothetical protein
MEKVLHPGPATTQTNRTKTVKKSKLLNLLLIYPLGVHNLVTLQIPANEMDEL